MKKTLLISLLSLLCFGIGKAQWSFGTGEVLSTGDTAHYVFATVGSFDPGGSGSSATWDFSAMTDSSAHFVMRAQAPGDTPHGSTFSAADYVTYDGLGNYIAYASNSDSLYVVGEANQMSINAPLAYSNPYRIFDFPMAMGNDVADNMNASYTATGFPVTRTGNIRDTVDGNGTLTAPDMIVYTNVNRVHKVITIKDSSNVAGIDVLNFLNYDIYEWYEQGEGFPRLVYIVEDHSLAGNPTGGRRVYYVPDVPPIAVDPAKEINLNIYPNPANDYLFVEGLRELGQVEISIMDITGRELLTTTSTGVNATKLDVSKLPAGMYTLSVRTDSRVITRKVVLR